MSKKSKKADFLTGHEIVYTDLEPGVINKEMIVKAYLDDGKKGEEARLHQMEKVVYKLITVLRLEFKNILRIDHLWMLSNLTKLSLSCNKIETIEHIEMLTALKELDLSFNYIEKIENLEKLVNLEVLTLFSNLIEKIENLDTLENLVILSIGNNKINSVDGIERFRFLYSLSVLNLEGNPIANSSEFPLQLYIAAILPNLKYYEYVLIKDDAREEGKELFYRELRDIEVEEQVEIVEREQKAKEEADAERLSSSFVEHLNGHQLYESLWKDDEDGRILMLVGQAAIDLAEDYDKDVYDVTQEIYKLGLEKYEERKLEYKEFMINLEEGCSNMQKIGQDAIEKFLIKKEYMFETIGNYLRRLKALSQNDVDKIEYAEYNNLAEDVEVLNLEFEDTLNMVWQDLMGQEMHLHEAIEESTTNFQRNMQEIMSKFIEQEQSHFAKLRDIAIHFSENISGIVSHYISVKMALQNFEDVPPDLQKYMEDRDAIMNLTAGMKDTHTQRIDEREDRMIVRSKEFVETLIDELNKQEMERNRAKVLEINSFLDLIAENLMLLHDDLSEDMMP